MVIDSHVHVFDRSVAGAEENFPLWPKTRWGAGEDDLLRQMDEAGIVHLAGNTRDVTTPQGRPFRAETMWRDDGESQTVLFDTIDGELVKVMEIYRTRR